VASRTIYVLEISGACYKKDSLTRANPTNTAVSMKKRVKNGIVAVIFVFGALSILNFQPATAFAQGTAFTYQGRVTDNGTNFTGLGQFKFALVTSTNANHTATATANAPSGGFITGYSTTFGGNGYLTAPAVTVFGGGGSGAAAHANLSAGAVASLAVDNPGNGAYTNAPTVLIAPPPAAISYTTYWSNDGTSANGSEPSAAVSVGVSNGLFTVVLGDATLPNMAAISASLFSRPGLQLRIWFNDGVNGFAALDPAQNLTPTPYATFANAASNLFNGLTIQQNDSGAPDVIGGSPDNFVSPGVIGATIAGGGRTNNAYPETNSVTADFGAVSGGWANTAAGQSSSVGGGYNNLASGDYANIAGGYQNTASNAYATVSGGQNNVSSGSAAAIGGGTYNVSSNYSSFVGGGQDNTAGGEDAIVGGGQANLASGGESTVAGGYLNVASGGSSFVGGGTENHATGSYSAISGGLGNVASGDSAAVLGGRNNLASGDLSIAGGYDAQASHNYSFVWSDFSSGTFSSTAQNQFSVRATGGIRFAGDVELDTSTYHHLSLSGGNALGYLYGSFPKFADGVHLSYNYYADAGGGNHVFNSGGATSRLTAGYGFVGIFVGGVNSPPTSERLYADSTGVRVDGTFNNNSDRNVKQDFAPVAPARILSQVLQLPLSQWSYKTDPATRHVGPMAQDFYSIFNLGTDDKHIAPIDEGGVAFGAIQGLNQKVEEQKTELEGNQTEITDLKQRLEKLERLLNARAGDRP
jgi:trimeric autotransporter adhesin